MAKQSLILGGGCFWCIEALFQNLNGVITVQSGYAGGPANMANYKAVCSGETGHAEVIRIDFDDQIIQPGTLLDIFFHLHDPTTLNRQGADSGSQYRSVIFYQDAEQKTLAQQVMQQVEQDKVWDDPIVTRLEALDEFYPAEDYHQDYYQQNSYQPYCQAVITPKIKKLHQKYSDLLNT